MRICLALLPLLCAAAPARAAARLDSSFGRKGVLLAPSPLGGQVAVGYGAAQDSEGRVVVSGVLSDSSGTFRLALWRFREDGSPDAAFGRGGVAVSSAPGWAWSLAQDLQGRLLAAGISGDDWRRSEGALVQRFLPDGRPDPDFGAGGRVLARSPLGGALAGAGAVAAAADGVLVAGFAADAEGKVRAAVWKLREDGRPDESFGRGGALILPQADPGQEVRASALRPGPDGDWYAAGTVDWRSLALWRFSPAGTPRADWGRGGLALARGMGRSIAFEAAGAVWVGGFAYVYDGDRVTQEQAVLTRFSQDASTRAATLSGGGYRNRESFALARSETGRSYLAGYAGDKSQVRAALWGADAQGRPDPRFNKGGVLVLPNAAGGKEDRIYALALDSSGRLLAAGFSRGEDGKMRLALWRFLLP